MTFAPVTKVIIYCMRAGGEPGYEARNSFGMSTASTQIMYRLSCIVALHVNFHIKCTLALLFHMVHTLAGYSTVYNHQWVVTETTKILLDCQTVYPQLHAICMLLCMFKHLS